MGASRRVWSLEGEGVSLFVTEGARGPWAGGIRIASRAGSLLVVTMRLPKRHQQTRLSSAD